ALMHGQRQWHGFQPRALALLPVLRPHVSAPELPKIEVANPLAAWGRALPPWRPAAKLGKITVRHDVSDWDPGSKQFPAGMQVTVPVELTGADILNPSCEVVLSVVTVEGKPHRDAAGKVLQARIPVVANGNGQYAGRLAIHYPSWWAGLNNLT